MLSSVAAASPPFSPVLLLGLALKPLRPSRFQPVFDALLRLVHRRHPDFLERMEPYKDAAVCIDPVDLPFVLLFEPNPEQPRLTVRTSIDADEVRATIRGPLEILVALAEGKMDGDALFFTRQLQVEGDTEVVVALRNAIDGAGVNLVDDFSSLFGPLSSPVRRLTEGGVRLFAAAREQVETVRRAMIAPAVQESQAMAGRVEALEEEVKQLRKANRRAEKVAAAAQAKAGAKV